jgi:hypothetical protein
VKESEELSDDQHRLSKLKKQLLCAVFYIVLVFPNGVTFRPSDRRKMVIGGYSILNLAVRPARSKALQYFCLRRLGIARPQGYCSVAQLQRLMPGPVTAIEVGDAVRSSQASVENGG